MALVLGGGLAALTLMPAEAATKTWNGGTSSDWATSGNWTGGTPTSSDAAIINSGSNGPTVSLAGATASYIEDGTTSTGGTLTVQSGGTLFDTNAYVGYNSGSTGTATVTGAGASWSNSSGLEVGANGSGTLTIQTGGIVSDATGSVGQGAGSTGTATVSGAGSSWSNSNFFAVGNFGSGTLTIQNGGSVSDVSAGYISAHAGSVGTVTVSGSGSRWSNSNGPLEVGDVGTGTLTVNNSGTVTAGGNGIIIGVAAGSTGTLNIGAASGSAAATPGTISANSVAFEAGTGTLVFNHTATNYVFAPAITGAGTIDVLAGNTILAGDMSQFTGSINETGGHVTTGAAQQGSVASLAANQQATAIQSHATAGELLGMTRPVTGDNYAYAGGMFGSAVGYAGAQYAKDRVTLLGGLAYGAQDYPNVRQGDAPTVAAALRYRFADPFGDKLRALHPYAEIGSWITPRESLTLTRDYADFATGAPLSGQGSTNATAWAEYGRAGMIWQADKADQLVGYGELGQQFMHFEAYSEATTAGNPFPVSVGEGLFRMGVARAGGAWTRDLSHDIYAPWSLTLAGDVARSFDVHSGLTASITGLSPMEAPNSADTWGEFGARLETRFTDQVAFDLDLTGTAGGAGIGTTMHGGGGITYRF